MRRWLSLALVLIAAPCIGQDSSFIRYYPPRASGAAVWGVIDGTLSDQQDLQNELEAKVSVPGSNGFLARTAPSTVTVRTITSSDGSNTISNSEGQAGNPDIVVDDSVFARYTQGTGGAPGTCAPGTFHVETDDTEFYYCDSTDSQTLVGAGFDVDSMATRWRTFSDFTGSADAAANGHVDGDLAQSNSGTGAQIVRDSGEVDGNHPGVWNMYAGTTTTGYAGVNATYLMLGSGELIFEMLVKTDPDLSDGTDGYGYYIGVTDAVNDMTPSDGCAVRYEDDVNSGKWEYVCAAASSETTSDSGVTVAADTWYKIRVTVNTAASSVNFLINGAASGDITTNIPTSTALRGAGFILKSSGTTGRSLLADYYFLSKVVSR